MKYRVSSPELHMSNRTAKFVSAIFASLLAGAPLSTVSHSAAADCLSGPKDQTPDGSHWHYRIEHPSERHCWYLRKEDDKASQLASPNLTPAAKPVSSNTEPAIQRSIADAHAELPQGTSVPTVQNSSVQGSSVTAVNSVRADTAPANTGIANAQTSVIATRWPGQPDANSPVSPQAAATNPVASAPSNSTTAVPRAVAAVTLATADSSSKSQFTSIPVLLTITMGALSLAAVMGSAIFRFGSTRWTAEREMRGPRRVDWGATRAGDPARSAYAHPRKPRGGIPRDPRPVDDPDRRIAEMLARLSRTAAA
jgi:hypothetical protein